MKACTTVLIALIAILSLGYRCPAFVGVTCGWNYSNDLAGPNTGTANTPLFNPDHNNPNYTWDDWAEELGAAQVDFVMPNCRGSYPATSLSAANLAPFIQALNNRGLSNRIKLALFDDNASSWVAQCNLALGYGFGYPPAFDISNQANWKYLWDYNYKNFFDNVPDANRFKINGRPVIIIWTGNSYFIANMQGNMSQALLYVRQQCQSVYGFNPYIIVSGDTIVNDTTCNNPSVIDATQDWFNATTSGGTAFTVTNFNGNVVGAGCAGFQTPSNGSWVDPAHGSALSNGLYNAIVANNAPITFVEGFTDWEENAALFRVRNLDSSGNALGYASTYYDYPNQRLNILRQYSNNPFPADLKEEIEGCDYYGGASGGANYYRNGSIGIERTSDTGGGWDVGWINSGEWFEWENVPIQGAKHFYVRVAAWGSPCSLHFVIDGHTEPSVTLPNTGGYQNWTTVDCGTYGTFASGSYHTVRLVCETGAMNLNFWQLGGTTPVGKTISLKSCANNLYVTASSNGSSPLIASSTQVGKAQKYLVVDQGNGYVALKSLVNNEYVSADNAGQNPLINNKTSAGNWETFQWIENTNGTISLKAAVNVAIVTADAGGSSPLIANRPRIGPWEQFIVTQY